MKCPYCDESIHLMAKFCPKCGLPLSEDTTLMGASLGSFGGLTSNRWVLGGGAAAIVVVAIAIGWASARNASPGQSVRRETVGTYTAPAAPQVTRFYGTQPVATLPAPRTISARSASPSSSTRWAYVPPAVPSRPLNWEQQPEPEAPPHRLRFEMLRERKPPAVTVAQPDTAPLPPPQVYSLPQPVDGRYPAGYAPQAMLLGAAMPVADGPGSGVAGDPNGAYYRYYMDRFGRPQGLPIGASTGPVSSDEPVAGNRDWVWDPVQERYAQREHREEDRVRTSRPLRSPDYDRNRSSIARDGRAGQ